MEDSKEFTFEISLSILDHLGRHLYRSFATVVGEAISNAWDADARNVWIYLDPDKKGFWIKDDGIEGMTSQRLSRQVPEDWVFEEERREKSLQEGKTIYWEEGHWEARPVILRGANQHHLQKEGRRLYWWCNPQ